MKMMANNKGILPLKIYMKASGSRDPEVSFIVICLGLKTPEEHKMTIISMVFAGLLYVKDNVVVAIATCINKVIPTISNTKA